MFIGQKKILGYLKNIMTILLFLGLLLIYEWKMLL